jgi:Asp-tRNA(Asn)/Glu-tRNA(Gln) amidotransferase A subunit family amidase
MSAQGPPAREVRDVRLGLEVMSQRDMRDPWWVPAPLEGPSAAKPIKVALARIPDDMETDTAVLALLRTAAGHLVDAGYDVVETEVPDLTGTWKLWCDLIMTELSVLQEAQMRELGSADFRQTLDGFLKMATILDRRGYMEAIAYRSRVLRDWLAFLQSYPVILRHDVTGVAGEKPPPGAGAAQCGDGDVGMAGGECIAERQREENAERRAAGGAMGRKSGSHRTLRWSKPDSNSRSHLRRYRCKARE